MKKTKDGIKRMLKDQWRKACNGYLAELLRMWELDAQYGYWSGDENGTMYHYGETHNLTMEDIMYIVDCEIEEDEVLAWEDYCLDAHEFGFDIPNLRAWHRGCPRTSKETFDTLRILKNNLAEAVEEERNRIKSKTDTIRCTVQVPKHEIDSITSIEDYVCECFHKHPERIRYEQ